MKLFDVLQGSTKQISDQQLITIINAASSWTANGQIEKKQLSPMKTVKFY